MNFVASLKSCPLCVQAFGLFLMLVVVIESRIGKLRDRWEHTEDPYERGANPVSYWFVIGATLIGGGFLVWYGMFMMRA